MKLAYLILLVAMLLIVNGFPQNQQRSEDEILQSLNNQNLPVNSPSGDGNTSVINQYGYENTGLINQFQQDYGIGNYGNILQDGTYNTAILYEYGNNISANLNQTGDNNYAEVVLTGTNINGNLTQDGFGNYIDQNLGGSDINYSVLQDGSNNQLIQYQTGLYSTSFQINQVGDGITTVIIDGP